MLTLFVVLVAAVAGVALITALIAHFRHDSFKDEVASEFGVLNDYLELELDKIRAKVGTNVPKSGG